MRVTGFRIRSLYTLVFMPEPLSHADVVAIEGAELAAWRDMYRAMPDAFRRQHGPKCVVRCRSTYTGTHGAVV